MERKFFVDFGVTKDLSIDYLLAILYDARATTLRRVEGISTAELHWQYRKGWNTIGALLSHIIGGEHVFRIEFVEGREMTATEEKKYLPGLEMGKYIPELITGESIENYLQKMRESRAELLAKINTLSTEDFQKRREGYDDKNGCNLAWILYHLAEDEVHHRGQISLLRKLYSVQVNEKKPNLS